MAKTLSQRVPASGALPDHEIVPNRAARRAGLQARLAEIREEVTELSAGAVRLGLGYTVPALLVLGKVWLAHPWGPLPFPSHRTIAERIGRHPETVGRQLRALEQAGLLGVFRTCARPGPDGRLVRRTNRYQFRSKVARNIRACPMPRRRGRSHLDSTSVARPPNRGAVPAPPPSRPATEAPQMVDPPPAEAPEAVVDGRQALAGVRAVLAEARRATR